MDLSIHSEGSMDLERVSLRFLSTGMNDHVRLRDMIDEEKGREE
jgi:hypothetical protein